MKIFYYGGPGNVSGTYRHYLKGEHDPSQIAITYSGQFFDVCRALDLEAKVVTHYREEGSFSAEGVTIENWPSPGLASRGIRYRLANLRYYLRLNLAILRYRPDAAVISDREGRYLLAPVALLGVKIIPSLHCAMWQTGERLGFRKRFISKLDGWFFRRCTVGVMCVSDESARQVRSIAGDGLSVLTFSPTYLAGTFDVDESDQAIVDDSRHRILFVGRVEADKGAFDLIEIAKLLRDQGRQRILFEICGVGGALEEMKRRVEEAGLSDWFQFHGYVGYPRLASIFQSAFAVIVPTRREFVEGTNKVVVEGVLSSKPVITSPVCASEEYFGDSVVMVPPEDTRAYADAIVKLIDDPDFHAATIEAGKERRAHFYDQEKGWASTLMKLLAQASPAFRVRENHRRLVVVPQLTGSGD